MNLNKTTITIAILIGLVLIFGMLWGSKMYQDYKEGFCNKEITDAVTYLAFKSYECNDILIPFIYNGTSYETKLVNRECLQEKTK